MGMDKKDIRTLEDTQNPDQADDFTRLRDQLTGLGSETGSEKRVRAGHLDLGPDIWLSTDPNGGCEMMCRPSKQGADPGFEVHLSGGDSGKWACLGMRFGPGALRGLRYLGLLTALRGDGLVAFYPTLRYFKEGGDVQDVATAMPVILTGGGQGPGRAHFAHIPIEATQLEGVTGCELNLFFLRNSFAVTFDRIEPLRVL